MLRALKLYYFAAYAALGFYLPFFSPWLEARGIRGLSLSIVSALLPAMSIIGPPAFGFLADALGLRGSLLRVASGGSFAAFAALGCLALASGWLGFGPIFAAILVFAFFRPLMVLMSDVVALELSRKTHTPYGSTRLWGTLGFLVAALVGGATIDPKTPAGVPIAIAATMLATFAVSFTLPSRVPAPALPTRAHVRAFVSSADVRLFLACTFTAQCAHVCYDLRFSNHLLDRGASFQLVTVAWALGALAEVGLMSQSNLLAARARPPAWISLAYAFAALRWLLVATLPGCIPLLLVQPLHAFSFGMMWVSSLAYVKERAPAHMLSTAQGIFTAVMAAGGVTGMLIWGPLYERAGGSVSFAVASLISGCACVLSVAFARKSRAAEQTLAAESP